MRRILIIANQTLGAAALDDVIRERIAEEPCEFVVAVPATAPEDLVRVDNYGVCLPLATEEQATHRAAERLDQIVESIRAAGASVEGLLGDADPWVLFRAVAGERRFDEVIISTLPAGISRWLKLDLPSRVERAFAGRVTTVTGE